MYPLEANPLAVLTFIVAPAVLTNASTVMGMQTANRFARANDRIRSLSSLMDGPNPPVEPELSFRRRQLEYAYRRALYLVRALTAFYVSVGSFAAATLLSLVGALFVILNHDLLAQVVLFSALGVGTLGVGGLIVGSGVVVFETRQTLAILAEEVEFAHSKYLPPILQASGPDVRVSEHIPDRPT